MTMYVFRGYKGRAEHTFTCALCGKPNRKRTFTAEHTVNPFNKNPDGSVRTPAEVSANARAEAKRQRDHFATKPICKACDDALSYAELKALRAERDELLSAVSA